MPRNDAREFPGRYFARTLKGEIGHQARAAEGPGRHVLQRLGLRQGVLPDFIVVGAMKAGTTMLYDYLCTHPQVVPAVEKEVHFFDFHFTQGVAWYRSQLPTSRQLDAARASDGRRAITGEASPTYLFHPLAARRARAVVPDVKIIVILRDPVDRAYSHYQTSVRHDWEALAFETTLEREEQRLEGQIDELLKDEYHHRNFPRYHWSYQAMSRYAEQLIGWLKHFPREQFLFVRNEDMSAHPDATFRPIWTFLDLPYHQLPPRERRVRGVYEPMSPTVRAQLTDYFAPHNEALAQLIGFDPARSPRDRGDQ